MNKFSFLLGISIMMSSCNSSDFDYSEYHTINQEQFKNSDTLKYEFSSMTDNSYKLYWSIRYSDEYEFSNLWLRINDNSKIVRVEVPLFDKTGKPLGQCTGGVCTQTIFWKIQELKEKDTISWVVNQNMRKNTLESISEVGFLIKKKVD